MSAPGARTIEQAEAIAWLSTNPAAAGTSVITSLPDVSEVPLSFDGWRAWFVDAARRVIRWVPADGVAIFYQSDVRYRGAWVDKGYLVTRAAEHEQATMVWHKVVCRRPPGTEGHDRASYSHMLCFCHGTPPSPGRSGPDVLPDAGAAPSVRSMGEEACRVACRYLRERTGTRTVVDPFCGYGTALAVANAFGLDAVGIDLSAKRCRAARRLVVV